MPQNLQQRQHSVSGGCLQRCIQLRLLRELHANQGAARGTAVQNIRHQRHAAIEQRSQDTDHPLAPGDDLLAVHFVPNSPLTPLVDGMLQVEAGMLQLAWHIRISYKLQQDQ